MHKCSKCGTEYEGNFCPECGTKWEDVKTCPQCGKTLAGNVKFCPDCGYAFFAAPPVSPTPAPAAQKPVTLGTKRLYTFVSVFPTALFVLLSVVFMLLYLAPVAVMPGGILLGQKIPSKSYGNVYEISNYEGSSLTGSLTALIVLAACALFLAALILVTAPFTKARQKRVSLFGKKIFLRNVFAGIGYALYLALFIISCTLFGQISNEDGGFGIIKTGVAPILILVFAVIGCLFALIFALVAMHLRHTYPALVKEQEKKLAAAQPTGFETWLKKHKNWAVAVSMLLIIAVIVGVSVPVAIVNRHNGVYYVYNVERATYDREHYFKLSGGTWHDEAEHKGEIIFDGENVALIYDASGGMDKTGSSQVVIEGTLVDDVLKLNGVVYAKEGHKHEFIEWKTDKEATCTERGSESQSCICGKTNVRESSIRAHTWENANMDATCAASGYLGYRCVVCGQREGTYVNALHINYITSGAKNAIKGLSLECTHNKIVIPDTYKDLPVTSIEQYAFEFRTGLTSIELPNSIYSIGYGAFRNCSALTEILYRGTVAEWQAIYKSENWDFNTGNYTITCTDGTIDKSGKVTYFEQ